ncbi:hypothetical protein E2P86_04115 [Sphingobacterium psychroaquaticum]|uniref:hypothetical protein n=1 Tax=Sphingobacterium psychroaquaticum TaxID=561061 RepID=UPI00106C03A7|nr:hypothetical protein [Sphingobacterium psychroaquaticum]QBQ40378.1 hypothetical protein E2P86_04115 [Sphingobacterium psychroaquaticum]
MNNNYIILEDEFMNQYKEVINFVLKYFEENTEDASADLTRHFPIMYAYLDRSLSKHEIMIEDNLDSEKAYSVRTSIFVKTISLRLIEIEVNLIDKSICNFKKQLMD